MILAVAVVAMMACAVIPIASMEGADSDAVSTSGTISVSYMGDGATDFTTQTTTAYDMYQAVVAVDESLGFTANVSEANQSWVSGYNPNINYGTIDTITDDDVTTDISSYHIYAYCTKTTVVDDVEVTTTGWYDALDAIGWMHPYSDYSAYFTVDSDKYSLAVANIAISYGAATSNQLNAITVKDLVTVARYDSAYQYSFNISGTGLNAISGADVTIYDDDEGFITSTLTTSVQSGVNVLAEQMIYGWGSNAYEALKDALGSDNVVGQEEYAVLHTNSDGSTYYTYYSWMDTILGSGTESSFTETTSTYKYWASYTSQTYDASSYCAYTFGYYSGVSGAPNAYSDFGLRYETSTYSMA